VDKKRPILHYSSPSQRVGKRGDGHSSDDTRTILRVGQLPSKIVERLRASKMHRRHAHLNKLLED
jgi:hypothetical protein